MPTVRTDFDDAVAIISLDRPARHNAIDPATRAALFDALRSAEADAGVRAIVLRGEGASFCSGRDRSGFLDPAAFGSHAALVDDGQAIRRFQVAMTKPVVCAMKGHVIGGGAELAIACDFRVAATDLAFRFAEVGFGVVGDTGSSLLLPRLVGHARAKWLLMSGAKIGAAEAVAWGLAEWSAAPGDIDALAMDRARLLARKPPHAMAAQKELLDASLSDETEAALAREKAAILALFDGAEFDGLHQAPGGITPARR